MKKERIPRKEREKKRLREEILITASELFSNLSYEKTTVQQIAESAEVSVGTIYNLFDSKEAIFLDLINLIIEDLDREIREASNRNEGPVDKIRSFFRTYLHFCDKHLNAMIVIHLENPHKMHGIINNFFNKQLSLLERYFSMAIEKEELVWDNPRLLSVITIGYIHSYAHILATEKDAEMKDDLISIFERTILQPSHQG
ncbi:MAG: TetR/AcrR family transcriptional regulator [Candidatus Krumholzibacteriales bacterium]